MLLQKQRGLLMDKYKRLASNTFTIALGTLCSKLLVFLLMPFYTRILSTESYGIADIIIQTCNLLIPLATIGIISSVIRYGLERKIDKSSVFTTGLITIFFGFGILLLFYPVLRSIEFLSGYTIYIYAFVFVSSVQSLCSQFARAMGYVRLYSVDGILSTAFIIALNILFLGVLKYGITGLILATIISDLISVVSIFFSAKLYCYISLFKIRKKVVFEMLMYSVPMIPNTVCVWIINLSDRYLLTYLIGSSANGIYAIANKISVILMMIANIFSEAWQISAVTEEKKATREYFFSKVAGVYQAVAFITASLLISTARITTKILASDKFYEAWQYIPVLVLAATFACLSSFLSSIYMVEKKSVYTFSTTLVCAVTNITLNLLLIPEYGIFGATFSTFISFFLLFLIRLFNTRRFIKIEWNKTRLFLNFIMIIMQSIIMIKSPDNWTFWVTSLCVLTFLLNYKSLIKVTLIYR